MFVFSSVSVDCLYIYMWLSLLQAWVYQHFRGWATRMCGADIRNVSIHAPCFLYHGRVCLHETSTESISIWRALSWSRMESTAMHVHLSRSTFTLDGSDTVTARRNICQNGCFVSLVISVIKVLNSCYILSTFCCLLCK
jgi:hypothetical protein